MPGNYDVGKYKPPFDTRFKPGNPGGPGRPKGVRSQDSFLRDELNSKLTVRIDGRERTLAKRELAAKMWLKNALEKQQTKALLEVIAESRRLFPEVTSETFGSALGDPGLDALIIRELLAGLQLGEADPDNPDPFDDLLAGAADLRVGADEGADGFAGEDTGGWVVDEHSEDDQ